jgi:hypothetical protein
MMDTRCEVNALKNYGKTWLASSFLASSFLRKIDTHENSDTVFFLYLILSMIDTRCEVNALKNYEKT